MDRGLQPNNDSAMELTRRERRCSRWEYGYDLHDMSLTHQEPPQQKNILSTLPPELLACILSYLSALPPSDIATCRLVNRIFNEHSSPFLLQRVVFARRLKALTKFRQVLQHPYFRLHVTELVYDGSTYAKETAMDWDQYLEDCERAPRDLEDEAWLDRQRGDRIAWEALGPFRDRDHMIASPSDHSTAAMKRVQAVTDLKGDPASPQMESSEAFRLGCNQKFADYTQLYTDQQWIRWERLDRNMLAAAFAEFPNLRSIAFTDYRGLAREGESYDTCCRRLFGKALEPQHAGVGGQNGIAGDGLFTLLQILAEVPKARINALAIGPHAFEYTAEDTAELADPYHPQNPRYLDISALENVPLGPGTPLAHILERLEHLRLALCYSGHCSDEEHMRGQVCALLKAAAPRLQTLTLHMIYLFWGGVREPPKVDNTARFDVFNSIITPLHMPYLSSLSLRRWILTAEQLKIFLLRHAGTLRDLHLLGCLCGDDEDELAQWGGQTLNLTGVELSGFLSILDTRSANPRGWKSVHPEQWRQMQHTVSEGEARALETKWLAGRTNMVVRQQRREILPDGEWWKQPVYSSGDLCL